MTFDEELTRAFDTLTDVLHAEVGRRAREAIEVLSDRVHVECERAASEARTDAALAASHTLSTALAAEASRHAASIAAAEARTAEAAAGADARVAEVVADAASRIAEGVALAEARAAEAIAAAEARTAEAREAIAAAEARASERILLPGFDPAATERLREAVRAFDQARTLTDILTLLMTSAALEAPRVALLLVQRGEIRVWRASGFPDPLTDDPVPASDGGNVSEAWRRKTVVTSGSPGGVAAPAFAGLPAEGLGVAVPVQLCGEVVALLYADRGVPTGQAEPPSPTWPDQIELLTRYAAVSLEALTAFKTARLLAGSPVEAPAPADSVTPDDVESARRYARLLVSEIKLYHEDAVADGRRERDLIARLGGEMAHARALYDQRVPPLVRRQADYFRDELVRTLANGDASLLEPGTVESVNSSNQLNA